MSIYKTLPRREIERRLAAEWMAENFPDQPYFLNFPLGRAPFPPMPGVAEFPWRRRVDGLAIKRGKIILVGFKVWKPMDGIDKHPVYKALVPNTPELAQWRALPVEMWLVTPRPTPPVRGAAQAMGIKIIEVKGGWIDEVVQRIEWLWAREGRDWMEERKRRRQYLGLD